jgi:hypothetical protein
VISDVLARFHAENAVYLLVLHDFFPFFFLAVLVFELRAHTCQARALVLSLASSAVLLDFQALSAHSS